MPLRVGKSRIQPHDIHSRRAGGRGGVPEGIFVPVAGEDDGVAGLEHGRGLDGAAVASLSGEGIVDDAGDVEAEVADVFEEPTRVISRAPEPDVCEAACAKGCADFAQSRAACGVIGRARRGGGGVL